MNSLLVLLVFLFSLSAFAKPQLKQTQLHMLNSRVAQLLDFNKNPESYRKITKNLSYKDKQVFQKLLAKKKGQKVRFFPFMSFLYIKDAKTQIAIEVVDVRPLKIKVDGKTVRTIDPKNIRGSFPGWKESKTSTAWWSWLIPEAQAWCFSDCGQSTEPSDWELLYGYAASSDVYAGDQPIVNDTDSAIVARETAQFVNEFGITRVHCKPSHLTGFNNANRNYIEIVGQGNNRSALECDYNQNNCKISPLDSKGGFRNLLAEKSKLDHEIVQAVSDLVMQETGLRNRINPNALDVSCDADSCRLVSSDSPDHQVGPEAMAKISSVDISGLGDRSTRNRTEELLTKFKELQKLNDLHTNQGGSYYPPENRGKALYTMMACCGSAECVSYVNNQGNVEMKSEPTSVGQ